MIKIVYDEEQITNTKDLIVISSEPRGITEPYPQSEPIACQKTLKELKFGRNLTPNWQDLTEITILPKEYAPIHIYFNEMSAVLYKSKFRLSDRPNYKEGGGPLGAAGGKSSGWRYRYIQKVRHPEPYNLVMSNTANDAGHFTNARPRNDNGSAISGFPNYMFGSFLSPESLITAAETGFGAKEINQYVRRAVSNGITYHTQCTPGHYVRNCPYWCWPEWLWGQPNREDARFELMKFHEGKNDNGVKAEPHTNPERFHDAYWINQEYCTRHNESFKVTNKNKKNYGYTLIVSPQYQMTMFYEHRSSQFEKDTNGQPAPDIFGSNYYRFFESKYTGWPIQMEDWSQFDVAAWGNEDVSGNKKAKPRLDENGKPIVEDTKDQRPKKIPWRSLEYWYPEEQMTEQFKYWFTQPAWNSWPKTSAKEDETSEETQERLWRDWNDFVRASKSGNVKPGRASRIRIAPPPGRYAPLVDGVRSYGWYPLNLGKRKPDKDPNTNNTKTDPSTTFFTKDGGYDYNKNARKANGDPSWYFSTYARDPQPEEISKYDENWRNIQDIDPEAPPTSSSGGMAIDLNLNWWDLFEITEGSGDGYMYGKPLWGDPGGDSSSEYDHIVCQESFSMMDFFGTGGTVGGDVPVRRTSKGKRIPYFAFNITADQRPKEIHFLSAPRGLKFIEEYIPLGSMGLTRWYNYSWTLGQPDRRHPRLKGPGFIGSIAKQWPTTNDFLNAYTYLMPTYPGALAWIIEMVDYNGNRTSVTIWMKKALRARRLYTWTGSQDPRGTFSEWMESSSAYTNLWSHNILWG
jgi:hypothetical protein